MKRALALIGQAAISNKERLTSILKILIAAGLLYYLISAVSFEEIFTALKGANYFLILLACILSFLNIYLQFWKWKVLCREIVDETERKSVLNSLLYGFSAGIITPFRVGEYVGRALAFPGEKAFKVTLGTLIDKFFAFIPVFFVGAAASALFLYVCYNLSALYFSILLIVILLVLFLFLYTSLKTNFWEDLIRKMTSKSRKLTEFIDGLHTFKLLSGKVSVKISLITFLTYLTYVVQYGFLVGAFSNHWDILTYVWMGMLVFFAKAVIPPVTFGELGIRESASVFFAAKLGLSSAAGFNSAIFLFFINVLIPSVPGAALLFRSRPSKKSDVPLKEEKTEDNY